jgi:hypothetical protein
MGVNIWAARQGLVVGSCAKGDEPLGSIKDVEFVSGWADISLSWQTVSQNKWWYSILQNYKHLNLSCVPYI